MEHILRYDPIGNKTLKWIFIIILIVITVFLRINSLNSITPGLNQDESAIGYNAYSILQTGKDEWGVVYPIYFRSFGDYKLPAYIYTTAIFVKYFGLNEYAVRAPSVIAGIICVMVLFLLLLYWTHNYTFSYICAILLSINPWHLQFSRAGFEVNFALTAVICGIYLFIIGVDKKNIFFLALSIIFFNVSLYSYNVTRLLAPLLFITLCFQYRKKMISIHKITLVILGFIFLATLVPFFITFFSLSGVVSAKSSLITSADILVKNLEMRSYLASVPSWYKALFYNKYVFMIYQYIENIALLFSGSFFFVSGSTSMIQGVGNVGTFYLFQLPLFIIGLTLFASKKLHSIGYFFYWFIITCLILALSKEVPHATRGYFLVIPITIFTASGLIYVYKYINNFKSRFVKTLFLITLLCFIFYNVQFYFSSYYYRFPKEHATAWEHDNKKLANYLKSIESKYKKIIIDGKSNFIYTSYLFYTAYSPNDYLKSAEYYKDGLLDKAKSWGKYEVRDINWQKEVLIPDALYVVNPQNWPANMAVEKYLYYPEREIVFASNEEIIKMPLSDISWLTVNSNRVIREQQASLAK